LIDLSIFSWRRVIHSCF